MTATAFLPFAISLITTGRIITPLVGRIGAARVTSTGPMVNSGHVSVINSGLALPIDSR
ncbi:hypothetical protein [Xenorhabdus bovienii]|uniref:hypothetical protein n=1 Tax=Xenorhabdus bovienii TaxID=40576 RepID=UPI003DA43939